MSDILGLLLVTALIVANGLFVAAEFSLVAVRRPAVDAEVRAGSRRARLVRRELSDLSFALSSAQFGITVTSLLVGYVAGATIGETIFVPVLQLLGLSADAAFGAALTGAFLFSTVLQMVLGELFPKNLAIAQPLAVAKRVTPATRGFGIVFSPVIRFLHVSAEAITERVFRVEVRDELEGGHSIEELARIVAASGEEGSLTPNQTALLRRAVGLRDRRVREAMVPRPDVVWVDETDSVDELLLLAGRTGHSRFPVRGHDEDDVAGTVHVKNVLDVPEDRYPTTRVRTIMVPVTIVPESQHVRTLLGDMRRESRTFALVVDEYGGTAGIVTMEDVLEQLVGDIMDEFDREGHDVQRLGAGRYLVQGALRLDEVERILGRVLPSGEYDTVAGFVISRLGHLARVGDAVRHDDLELTVREVEGNRITRLLLTTAGTAPANRGAGA